MINNLSYDNYNLDMSRRSTNVDHGNNVVQH